MVRVVYFFRNTYQVLYSVVSFDVIDMVDYTILKKPILLFAYDLDDYLKNERGFYFDYRQKVPGKIVYDIDELIESIKDEDFHMEKLEEFSQFQFGDFKANASKSILDYILED